VASSDHNLAPGYAPVGEAEDDGLGEPRDGRDEPARSSVSRLTGIATSLLGIHVEIARREAERDQQRLIGGVVALGLGASLLLLSLLVVQVLCVFLLRAAGLTFPGALGVLALSDALFGLVCLIVGRSRLRGPVLPETRAMLRRTFRALLSP
jgi:uncharacterized membrane protein YqjE